MHKGCEETVQDPLLRRLAVKNGRFQPFEVRPLQWRCRLRRVSRRASLVRWGCLGLHQRRIGVENLIGATVSRLSPPSWLRCSRGFAPKVRRPISSAVGRQFAGPENLETYFQASSAWRPLTGSSSTQPHRHPLAYRRLPLVASRFICYSAFDFFPRPRFPGSGGCTL